MAEEDVPDTGQWEELLATSTFSTMKTAQGVLSAMLITLPQVVLLSLAVYSALVLINLPLKLGRKGE